MHPANAEILRAPGEANRGASDCGGAAAARDTDGAMAAATAVCYTLANNHVMDFRVEGLEETLDTLDALDGRSCGRCGAGRTRAESGRPFRDRRSGIEVFAVGLGSSGIPEEWAAGSEGRGAGVYRVERLTPDGIDREVDRIAGMREAGSVAVASIHWGGNWGWRVPAEHRRFARELIDRAGVAIVHGHSSHHVKGFELHNGGLILYGCGDFLSDYEGIPGHDAYRPDLSLMYFAEIDDGTGALTALRMVSMRTKRFSLTRAADDETGWLARTLNREGKAFETPEVYAGSTGVLECPIPT